MHRLHIIPSCNHTFKKGKRALIIVNSLLRENPKQDKYATEVTDLLTF